MVGHEARRRLRRKVGGVVVKRSEGGSKGRTKKIFKLIVLSRFVFVILVSKSQVSRNQKEEFKLVHYE